MSRRDFLIEIGTEELPPRSLQILSEAFATGLIQGLTAAQLSHGKVQRFATPRRLAVLVKGLAEYQPEQDIKRKGPPVTASFDPEGLPTRAALAFAHSCGVAVEALQRIAEPKGEFLYFSGVRAGAPARDLLTGVVQTSLDALPIPKRMHWGSSDVEFVRPVHWVLMLFGGEVLPGQVLGINTDRFTYGHRFHAPKALSVSSPGSYVNMLRKRGFVLADFEERRETIRKGVLEAAQALRGAPVWTEELLDEVTSLVEWPSPVAGHFERKFLDLPREVLISTLQDHQRYFPVVDASGALLPHFITVANIDSRDPEQVRAGNERVIRPRLTDAAFFYETDRKKLLAANCAALAAVTFQTRLGSIADKTSRVRTLTQTVAGMLGSDVNLAVRAAELCKCDLLTLMVGEFPELQGTMGRYYALHDGEPSEVAEAIAEHYLPRFAGDALPRTRAGMAVAIADKLDTITGIFAIDQKPSGTRDPFGLRRAALGLLRIIIGKRLTLDLHGLIEQAVALCRADIEKVGQRLPDGKEAAGKASAKAPAQLSAADIASAVYDYVMERLRAYYTDGMAAEDSAIAVSSEMFDAVLATKPKQPLDFDARIRAVEQFLKLDEAASLTQANKRIANILRQAGESAPQEEVADPALAQHDEEKKLFDELGRLEREVTADFASDSYAAGLSKLAALRPAVDAFFDKVMVMDPDTKIRANRLRLLGSLRGLFLKVADLSRLPG